MLPWNRHFHWLPFGTSQISKSFFHKNVIFKTAPNYAKYQIYPYPYFTPPNFSYPKRPDSEPCCPSCPFRAENGRSWSERRKTRAARRWIGRENWSWSICDNVWDLLFFLTNFEVKCYDGICTVYNNDIVWQNYQVMFILPWMVYMGRRILGCSVQMMYSTRMGMSSSSPHSMSSCPFSLKPATKGPGSGRKLTTHVQHLVILNEYI